METTWTPNQISEMWLDAQDLGLASIDDVVTNTGAGIAPPVNIRTRIFAELGIRPYMELGMGVDAPEPAEAPLAAPDPYKVVWITANSLGRKFIVEDITDSGVVGQELYDAACHWLEDAPLADMVWSDWLHALAVKYRKGGGLSDRNAKGVLNCMVPWLRRQREEYRSSIHEAMTLPCVDSSGREIDRWAAVEEHAGAAHTMAEMDDDDRSFEAWLASQAQTTERMGAALVAQVKDGDANVSEGYYTVELVDGGHRTIRLSKWKQDNRRPGKQIRWIGYLSGPSNTSDYETFARQHDDGSYVFMPRFREDGDLAAALAVVLHGDDAARVRARHQYALESSRCARCNRELTVPASIHMGLGPECASRI